MSDAWVPARLDHKQLIEHMAKHGVFTEAGELLDRIDRGEDDSEITPAAQALEWLADRAKGSRT